MAYPYSPTVQGLKDLISQLRSNFPTRVTSETLKKWSIASNNEGVVLTVLRFLRIIDEEGNQISDNSAIFFKDDQAFEVDFGKLVQQAYQELFELYGEGAWELSKEKLVAFFRSADRSSERVGSEQARTFGVLAQIAGHSSHEKIAVPKPRSSSTKAPTRKKQTNDDKTQGKDTSEAKTSNNSEEAQLQKKTPPILTVRIEINLPVAENQEVYDNIFRSIRENLFNE